jgi:general secretion pathway protein K
MAVSYACQSESGQRGIALITVMLIVALATIAALAMASRQQLDVRRIASLLHGDQAYAYALGVENWGSAILQRDQDDGDTDNLGEDWAQRIPPLPVPGGQIRGHIEDLQGRFNLNNLVKKGAVSPPHLEQFRRVLAALELDGALAAAVVDWIDVDIDPQLPDGAEDSVYLSQDPPYRAANRPFTSISELRLVQGFDAKAVNRLLPYISVLPGSTPINVNTASTAVLRSLAEDLSDGDAQRLVEDRGEDGYESVADFLKHDSLAGLQIEPGELSVSSEYFLIHADVELGQARTRLYSLVKRPADQPPVTLVRTQVE